MKIKEIKENKKQFLPLLLLADEQEDMIDRYINKGTMYVLDDDGVKCECVITDEGKGVLEIKNIATEPEYQGKGYGKALIDFVATTYKGKYSILQVGTGDSPLTIPFYEKCGFIRSHSIKNFFTDNYDHSIYEAGTQLVDMIYLQKNINSNLSNQSSETLVFSRKIGILILVPYVFSLIFALMSRNKGNFLFRLPRPPYQAVLRKFVSLPS